MRASTSLPASSLQFLLEVLTCCCNAVTGWSRRRCKVARPPTRSSCQVRGLQTAPASGPDISLLKPHLQQEWDHEANAWLGNVVIRPYSGQKVQWVCTKCPLGQPHVWQTRVYSRTQGGGCLYCSGRAVCPHNSLATLAPNIASEWDFGTNQLTPCDYTHQSGFVAGWCCSSCHHAWNARISNRTTYLGGCPECARQRKRGKEQTTQPSLVAVGERVMEHWDHERNAAEGWDPARITLGSRKKVHWLCSKCPLGLPHRWSARPNIRFSSSGRHLGCPCCSGQKTCKCNSLQTLYPDLAMEWDFTKNDGTPDDCAPHFAQKVWWVNDERGSWQTTPTSRVNCYNKKVA